MELLSTREKVLIFFQYFIPITALFLSISLFSISYYLSENKDDDIKKETSSLEFKISIFEESIGHAIKDCLLLKKVIKKSFSVTQSIVDNNLFIADIFKFSSEINPNYQQVRYINYSGDELVRVDKKENHSFILKTFELQNKAKRGYFLKTAKISKNSVYLSRIEPNYEHGEMEIPINPVLRISSPIKENDSLFGMVIINIGLKEQIKNLMANNSILFSNNGYIIASHNKNEEWGNYFLNRKNQTLENLYPEIWKAVINNDAAVIDNDKYIFVLHKINFSGIYDSIVNEPTEYYLGSFFDKNDYTLIKYKYLYYVILINILLSLTLSYYIAEYQISTIAYNRELTYHANVDQLTQLDSRKNIYSKLEKELNRVKRYHTSSTIIMLDLDLFKDINDKHGHLVGDIVLSDTTQIIRDNLRDTDSAGRLGGEEFLVILPETNLENGKKAAEKIRAQIENKTIKSEDLQLKVTISIGITEITENDTIKTLMSRADILLYESKKSGRNKITSK